MGAGYSRPVVQWSRGEYTSANNQENDISMISSVCPLRGDQHGGDITTASAIDFTTPRVAGLIESSTDMDVFRFVSGGGDVSFTVAPATVSPNLDVVLALYNGVGNLVTSASPTTMGATLVTSLTQGTYYLAVDGTGTGSPTTAYNDYGSLGQYFLSVGALVAAQNQAPTSVTTNSKPLSGVAPLAVTFSSLGSTDSDGTIASYDWDFGNGARSTAANPAYTYTTPGTYTASLVVIDNSGIASPPSRVTVQVQNGKQIYVANLTVTTTKTSRGFQATATVTVRDATGALRPNARVTGTWSGRTSGTVSASTNSSGVARFNSALSSTAGTFTFTVTGLTLSGFTYAPTLNVRTSASATAL
jgi:PKD repeat protein